MGYSIRNNVDKSLVTIILSASLAILTFILVGFASPVQAMMLKFSLQELATGADIIIVGSVTKCPSQWNTDHSHIETLVTLSVEEYLKGYTSNSRLTVTVPGGEVAGITEMVSDTPFFGMGERVVVFLKNLSNQIEVYGNCQGKLSIEQGQAGVQHLEQIKVDIKQALNGAPVPSQTEWQPAEPSSLDVPQLPITKLESSQQASTLADGWQTITSMDFESGIGAGWLISGNPTWGPTTYKANAGSYSGWCARGGTLGVDPATNNYPNNMSSSLIYGPFNLSGANAVDLSYYLWLRSEASNDYFKVLASVDGSNFYGYRISGILDSWSQNVFDLRTLPTLGNLCGRSQVWIAFKFDSDTSTADKGAFLDNIVLRKYVGVFPQINQISPASASAGTHTQVTINGSGFGNIPGMVNFFHRTNETQIGGTIISWSDTSIVTTVPELASSGPVYVSNTTGNSLSFPFTVMFSYGGVEWPTSNPVVNFRINPNTADCTGEEMTVQTAAATWNAVPGKSFTFNYAGATGAVLSSYDGVNEILWRDLGSTGPLAHSILWTNIRNNLQETDIEFNDYYTWSTDASPPTKQLDIQAVALHEMGHWLRLNDLYGNVSGYPQDVNKVMYGIDAPLRTLDAGDIAGMQWIYPPVATKLVFTSMVQSLTAGSVSNVITIQNLDASNNPANVTTSTIVSLTSTSAVGRFDTSPTGLFNGTITSVTIASGSNSANFYYRDTAAGTPTITTASTGLTSGTQQETVTAGAAAQVRVETAANGSGNVLGTQTLIAGNTLVAYGVTRDQYNNYVGNPTNTTWSLINTTGGVANSDLSAASGASITMTGHLVGTAVIHAINGSLTPGDSGIITIRVVMRGDANGDGKINMADVTKVERIILGLDPLTPSADANGDGKINMADVTKIERIILGLDPA